MVVIYQSDVVIGMILIFFFIFMYILKILKNQAKS
jgi:hypothetical protein